MLKAIKEFLFGKAPASQTEAPYKVEAPAAAPSPVAEQATQAVVASIAPAKEPKAKPAKKPKAPAEKKAKAPRKPKAAKAPKA